MPNQKSLKRAAQRTRNAGLPKAPKTRRSFRTRDGDEFVTLRRHIYRDTDDDDDDSEDEDENETEEDADEESRILIFGTRRALR